MVRVKIIRDFVILVSEFAFHLRFSSIFDVKSHHHPLKTFKGTEFYQPIRNRVGNRGATYSEDDSWKRCQLVDVKEGHETGHLFLLSSHKEDTRGGQHSAVDTAKGGESNED